LIQPADRNGITTPEMKEAWAAAAQERIRMLMERGFHEPGDVEDRLGYHVGRLGR
jgi:hypothetical protein